MERETKEITTTGGNKVTLKTYLTGRESNEIQSVYLKEAKLSMIGQQVAVEGFKALVHFDATRKTLEVLVVALNGNTDKPWEKVLDLPVVEYEEVVSAIAEITGKKKE